jgi:all-trans-8'-apo-beta-carotenal 15,15'-oxygenase
MVRERHIDYDIIFRNCEEEPGRALAASSGAIPTDLRGTLLRNGGGRYRVGADPVGFFDACGIVAGLEFRDGGAFFRARHVRSPLFVEEERLGRQARRRAFTNLPRGRNFLNGEVGNPAMHDAVYFGGRLLATDDTGYFRLDPQTLETIGGERLGRVSRFDKLCPVTRIDRARDRLIGYYIQTRPLDADVITMVEIDRDWKIAREVTHRLDHSLSLTHEVAFTERWFVVVELPVRLSIFASLVGMRTLFDSFERIPGKQPIVHLVPRDPGAGPARSFPLPGNIAALFHNANAFDADGGTVVLDAISFPWYDFAILAPPELRARRSSCLQAATTVLRRYQIDLSSGKVTERELCRGGELPRINASYYGRPYRYAYLPINRRPNGSPDPFLWAHELAKVDVERGTTEVWDAGPARFLSQPVFAPRAGSSAEDDGYLVCWVVNAERGDAEVVILDATTPASGPIATLELGHFLGLAAHCRFEPELSLVR